jgi:hypothetical protein
MVHGDGAEIASIASLTGPPEDWEGPPLLAILERFADRIGLAPRESVVAVGLATVDLDRAAATFGEWPFWPAPGDALLGARGRATTLASGRTLLLLQPSTEGRLAAFLARHGEGLAALYLARPAAILGARATTLGYPASTALGRPGHLVAGARVGDPVIILVG